MVALLLVARGLMLWHSGANGSVNYDEVEYVYSGVKIWRDGDFSVSPHPPVPKLLAGLALLPTDAELFFADPRPDRMRTAWPQARRFLHCADSAAPYGRDPMRAASRQRWFVQRLPWPVGVLLVLVLLPVALLFLGAVAVSALFGSVGRARRSFDAPPRDPARETALCSLVRGLALDPTFTRDEALATPVIAGAGVGGGPAADDLLREAIERGWVEARGDRFTVTAEGRRGADEFLRRQGL